MTPVWKKAVMAAIVLVSLLVLYLSWTPDPNLHFPQFIPAFLKKWTNDQSNENLRTAVPFLLLGACFSLLELEKPFRLGRHLLVLSLFFCLVTLAEIGQIFIPHRSPDAMDIIWGVAGALLGMIIPLPIRLLLPRSKA